MSKTKITARAGFNELYPENTLLAFQKAVQRGADRIELDVHMSADGYLSVHHFYALGHTNNGAGAIFEHDAEYLRSLDAGSWLAPQYRGERIPFLHEVFDACGSSIEYEIDLKGFSVEFLQLVLDTVKEYGLWHCTEFTSAFLFLLAHLRRLEPHAHIGMFVRPFPAWMTLQLGHTLTMADLQLGEVNVAHCPPDILTREFVQHLHAIGVQVHASNCDTPEALVHAYTLGVDQLSTNKLELALATRAAFEGATLP